VIRYVEGGKGRVAGHKENEKQVSMMVNCRRAYKSTADEHY
jgi:hypothetical protein